MHLKVRARIRKDVIIIIVCAQTQHDAISMHAMHSNELEHAASGDTEVICNIYIHVCVCACMCVRVYVFECADE